MAKEVSVEQGSKYDNAKLDFARPVFFEYRPFYW